MRKRLALCGMCRMCTNGYLEFSEWSGWVVNKNKQSERVVSQGERGRSSSHCPLVACIPVVVVTHHLVST